MSRSTAVWACFVLTMTIMFSSARLNGQVSVATWHNDNWRTGQNTNQTALTPDLNRRIFPLDSLLTGWQSRSTISLLTEHLGFCPRI